MPPPSHQLMASHTELEGLKKNVNGKGPFRNRRQSRPDEPACVHDLRSLRHGSNMSGGWNETQTQHTRECVDPACFGHRNAYRVLVFFILHLTCKRIQTRGRGAASDKSAPLEDPANHSRLSDLTDSREGPPSSWMVIRSARKDFRM